MPIRNSYGDPHIAEAFDNLGKMFKPPTGSDLYGYAHAATAKAELARKSAAFANINAGTGTAADYAAAGIPDPSKQFGIADMYRRSQQPGAKPEDLDAGSYAVHGNANNTFEGQGRDLKSKERNKLIEERTKVVTSGMTPVAQGATRFVPPTAVPILGYDAPAAQPVAPPDPFAGAPAGIASLYAGGPAAADVSVDAPATSGIGSMFGPAPLPSAPAAPQTRGPLPLGMTQTGNIDVKPGERVVKPDGSVLEGSDKPQTLDQWKAQEAAGLRKTNVLDDPAMRALIMGTTPIESVVTPEGNRNVYRPDSIGQEPTPDDTKAVKPILTNYKLPDMGGKPGYAGTAVYDPVVGYKDSQTAEKLPPGAVTYTANLTGDKAGTGLGPTTANTTDAVKRGAEVTRTLDTLDLYEGLVKNNPGAIGLPGLIRGTAQNAVGVLKDASQAFGKSIPQVDAAAGELREGLRKVAPAIFDKSIPEAAFLQGTLAYALARTENPSGEVSRQAYERALERMKGGYLTNTDSAMASVGAMRQVLNAELAAINATRNPATARTDVGFRDPGGAPAAPSAPGAVEKWTRGPDGQPVRAQ